VVCYAMFSKILHSIDLHEAKMIQTVTTSVDSGWKLDGYSKSRDIKQVKVSKINNSNKIKK